MIVLFLIHLLNTRVDVISVPLLLPLKLFPFSPHFTKAHTFEVVHSRPDHVSLFYALPLDPRCSTSSSTVLLSVIFHGPFFGHPNPSHYVFNYVPLSCFFSINILSQCLQYSRFLYVFFCPSCCLLYSFSLSMSVSAMSQTHIYMFPTVYLSVVILDHIYMLTM